MLKIERSNAILILNVCADIETKEHPWLSNCPKKLKNTLSYFLEDEVKKVFLIEVALDDTVLKPLHTLRKEIESIDFARSILEPKYEKVISNMPNLKRLLFTQSKINNLNFLRNSHSLKSLDISYNEKLDLEPLKNLKSLESLTIDRTPIEGLSNLNALKSLTNLELYFVHLTDISCLKDFKSLKSLSIDQNKIVDLIPIKNLHLELLSFGETDVKTITPLINMVTLKDIYLSDLVSENDISILKKNLPDCDINR